MKRKLFVVGLSLVAAATVVGSGFSAWYFGDGTIPSDQNVTISSSVTDKITNKGTSLTVSTTSAAVLLDQGKIGNETDISKGITVNPGTISGTFKFAESGGYTNLTSTGQKIVITTTCVLNDNFARYVKFDTSAVNAVLQPTSSNTYTFKTDVSADTEVVTFDFTSHPLTYQEGMKPLTSGDYDTMKPLVTGNDMIKITFHASLENIA